VVGFVLTPPLVSQTGCRALRLRGSDDYPHYYQLGRFYAGVDQHDQAAEAFRRALRLSPDSGEARQGL
jgi:cytochrome c-type biogenesis protein CcmH/NrfG